MTDQTDPRNSESLLEGTNLVKHFAARGSAKGRFRRRGFVHAVEDVSITLRAGEIVAVVGESGSGKTTVGRLMSRLENATSGTLTLRGQRVPRHGIGALRPFRRDVQVVFQDPYASLNAAHTIGYHVQRPLLIHGIATGARDARRQTIELLERVHLGPAQRFIDCYPQQLSGGQRQRVAIARALAVNPAVIIADEPVASLDVSIRLSILNLFAEIAASHRTAILYITHDIASARYFADRVLVMYAGQIVEQGPAEAITTSPQHPYTQLLVSSAPDPDRRSGSGQIAEAAGEAASMIAPPTGCRFHPRCPYAMPICTTTPPPTTTQDDGRQVSCWLVSRQPNLDDIEPVSASADESKSRTGRKDPSS